MKRLLNIEIISLILFTAFSCKDDVIIPPELQPGRRDYTWTVDTIGVSGNSYYRMWASSPADVWATNSGDATKAIAHFNGLSWVTYYVPGMNNPGSIYGFAYNNIYIASRGGGIWKFNGANWSQFAQLSKDGQTDIGFNDIWGESSIDFYAFGGYPDSIGAFNNSFIAHYYNNNWLVMDTKGVNGIVAKLFKNSSDKKMYILTYKLGGGINPDSSMIYEFDQGYFNKIYSSIWTGGKQADISLINNEVYFILGYQIAKRVNGQFQTFLQVDNSNFYQRIWGRNYKDIFLLMYDGLVHYNGNNMEYLFHFNKSRTQIFGAALFEKDAFFLVDESQTGLSLVYHGKLK